MFKFHQALSAIKDKPEFTCKDKGSYSIIDYNLKQKNTFIGKTEFDSFVLKNLRGTAFDNITGDIVRLGYGVFFNLGEFPESDAALNFEEDHLITQKVDGSCIFPIYIREQEFVLGTRAGVTDISQFAVEFISDKPHYSEFIDLCRSYGSTPIFEFCSRKNRVVIDYPEDMLVLTGIRYITSGNMVCREKAEEFCSTFNIPLVKQIKSIDSVGFSEFQKSVKNLVDDEGVVITFTSGKMRGHMIKLKSEQYCDRHHAVDSLKWDHDCVKLIVTGLIDDVIPMLAQDRAEFIKNYAEGFMEAIDKKVGIIRGQFHEICHIKDRKTFAAAVLPLDTKAFMFKLFVDPNYDVRTGLIEYATRMANNQGNVKELKNFIGFDREYK